eukprot:GHVR01013394.1.p1 GENE.GHVR01013394.1~~GHVR01013394.1.p1  ORF type:complete len:411 (+),score=54.01 GHVR01013394.1:105-1337(+)
MSCIKKRKNEFNLLSNEQYTDPEVDNLNIVSVKAVIYPQLLMEEMPLTTNCKETVMRGRNDAIKCLSGADDRLFVVIGPCSIHDPVSALEYANKLKAEMLRHSNELAILMRVYFEKPRTTVGWKGLINDPHLDETFDINQGLKIARRLMLSIVREGIPCACEYLDTVTPQYIGDLVSWAAIGARTTESQLHRQLSSGLSTPVGFKNGTNGDIQVAVDAIRSALHKHCFLGITKQGLPAIVLTKGNKNLHIVLRGGADATNYDEASVKQACTVLEKAKLPSRVMIDFSHGNSKKDFKNQSKVTADVASQIAKGSKSIFGVMIESHIFEGSQSLPVPAIDNVCGVNEDSACHGGSTPTINYISPRKTNNTAMVLDKLRYGVSITDGCVGWDETVTILETLANAVKTRRLFNK